MAEARVYPLLSLEPADVVTRAELLAEGDLIEVPRAVARQAGWRVPVAISRGVYETLVRHPDAETCPGIDPAHVFDRYETGRLWWVCRAAVFKVATASAQEKNAPEIWVRVGDALLILHRGPDDQGNPVATICTEGER